MANLSLSKKKQRSAAAIAGALALFSATGCKKALDVRHSQAYIIGTSNDIRSVDKETEAKIDPEVLRGAVLIATHLEGNRVKYCSGSLIVAANGTETYRVLSNHHCFAEADADGKATKTLMAEACTKTSVYFGYVKGQTAESSPISCKPGSLRTNFDGDLSVFALAKNPPDKYRPLALWDEGEVPEGRAALIVHYPDVEAEMAKPVDGGAKLPTAAATLNDCKVLGLFAVSEWDLDRTLPYSLRHTCDLIHGSSGSGLIDVKTGKILGVNWGGIKISLDDGTRTDNVATRAKFAQAFLDNKVDDEIKAAHDRRSSADAVASGKNEGGAIKSKSQAVSETVKRSCGVSGGAAGMGALLLLLVGMLAPVASAVTAPGSSTAVPLPGKASACSPSCPSPQAAWAVSYLLNEAFLAEFASVAPTAAEADKKSLAQRAVFAVESAKLKTQSVPALPALSGQKPVEAAALAATFSATLAPHWDRLTAYYAQPSPSCPIDADDVKDFAAHQKELLGDGTRGLNARTLMEPVASWDLAKMQCLVFALTASTPEAKAHDGYDPIHLLAALQQAGSPLMKDDALRAMAALRHLQLGQYAETLRALVELSDGEPAFRLAYDVVQRVFSARQKGEGAVALQGM